MCDLCTSNEDLYEHMFVYCEIVNNLWREIEAWISEIGVREYVIDENIIIVEEIINPTG